MEYLISTMLKDIRIALDQNNVSTQLFDTGDVDTLSLDELIKSKITDAVRVIEMNAPQHLLGPGVAFPDESEVITWESQAGYGPGSVILPDDFLRLVCFKMSDWDHPVFVPITVADPLYTVQRSRFGGVRGNPQKPVCALVPNSAGLKLEFYSCAADSNAAIAMASYIPMPVITNPSTASAKIAFCDKLYSAVIYQAAGLVCQAIGNDAAEQFNNLAQTYLQ